MIGLEDGKLGLTILLFGVLLGCGFAACSAADNLLREKPQPVGVGAVMNSPERVGAQQHVAAEALVLVWRAKPKLSQARQRALADALAHIARSKLPLQARRPWMALIGLESTYDGRARSRTGAVGLGQLLPHYRADFGRTCGFLDTSEADLQDDYTNLNLSACYFGQLLAEADGNLELAMIAYSAGQYSQDYKRAQAGTEVGNASRAYVANINARSAH
jgi:soluble lytic murein transglycosylase-like protein